MSPLSISELEQLLATMKLMLEAANERDWAALAQLDDQRRVLVGYPSDRTGKVLPEQAQHRAVIPPDSSQNEAQRSELIEQISTLDKQILGCTELAKDQLLTQNREMSAQIKAKAGYAQASLLN